MDTQIIYSRISREFAVYLDGSLIGFAPTYHDADLITRSLDLGPPHARVPDAPGLGVELDENQLKRWRVG